MNFQVYSDIASLSSQNSAAGSHELKREIEANGGTMIEGNIISDESNFS